MQLIFIPEYSPLHIRTLDVTQLPKQLVKLMGAAFPGGGSGWQHLEGGRDGQQWLSCPPQRWTSEARTVLAKLGPLSTPSSLSNGPKSSSKPSASWVKYSPPLNGKKPTKILPSFLDPSPEFRIKFLSASPYSHPPGAEGGAIDFNHCRFQNSFHRDSQLPFSISKNPPLISTPFLTLENLPSASALRWGRLLNWRKSGRIDRPRTRVEVGHLGGHFISHSYSLPNIISQKLYLAK